MGHNDHIDFDLHERIRDLVDEGDLEEGAAAFGVAQQVIHQGYESLTERQCAVYNSHVGPALEKQAERWRIIQAMNSAHD